jgi:uncharacterized membrane protein YjdF
MGGVILTDYTKNRLVLTVVVFAIQALVIALLINKGAYGFFHNVLAATCFWAVLTFVELKYGLCLDNYIRTVAIITIVSDSVLGYYLNFYVTSHVYDRIQHIFGIYAFALLAYIYVLHITRRPMPRILTFILVVALGISLGAVFEMIEYLADIGLNPVVPNQPSLEDTDLDLLSDLIGAIIAGSHSILMTSRNLDCDK